MFVRERLDLSSLDQTQQGNVARKDWSTAIFTLAMIGLTLWLVERKSF
jgi:hypothetical protein